MYEAFMKLNNRWNVMDINNTKLIICLYFIAGSFYFGLMFYFIINVRASFDLSVLIFILFFLFVPPLFTFVYFPLFF